MSSGGDLSGAKLLTGGTLLRQVGPWALVLIVSGCGYSLGYRTPPNVETIAIPIFQNVTFPLWREVEYEVTEALRREVQARTRLRLTYSDTADLVVLGTVREFRPATLAEGEFDEKIESVLIVSAALVVEDYRNEQRYQVDEVRVSEPFSDQFGEGVDSVRPRAVKNLAEKMLLAIESWEDG
jgi:hypothetical protein